MDLFTKLNRYIDYNNHYSITKVVNTLGYEFNSAVSSKNYEYAKNIILTLRKIHDRLSQTYRESEGLGETMSYSQKLMSQKIKKFISYLVYNIRSEVQVSNYEQEIGQAINLE